MIKYFFSLILSLAIFLFIFQFIPIQKAQALCISSSDCSCDKTCSVLACVSPAGVCSDGIRQCDGSHNLYGPGYHFDDSHICRIDFVSDCSNLANPANICSKEGLVIGGCGFPVETCYMGFARSPTGIDEPSCGAQCKTDADCSAFPGGTCTGCECFYPPTPTPTPTPTETPTPTPTITGTPTPTPTITITPTPTPIPCNSVNGIVWIDSVIQNGAKDAGESGYNGATVTALLEPGPGSEGTVTTSGNGDYSLVNLCTSSKYSIFLNVPAGYQMESPFSNVVGVTFPPSPQTVNFWIIPTTATPTPTSPPTPTPGPVVCNSICDPVLSCTQGSGAPGAVQYIYVQSGSTCAFDHSACVGNPPCVVPPTPTPIPPTATPTPTPIPTCPAGTREKIVTVPGPPGPTPAGCKAQGSACGTDSECCSNACGVYGCGAIPSQTTATGATFTYGDVGGTSGCAGSAQDFYEVVVYGPNDLPIRHTFTGAWTSCGSSYQTHTSFAVFGFYGLDIPKGSTIISATFSSPSSSGCQAGWVNVGSSPVPYFCQGNSCTGVSFPNSGDRFGANALTLNTAVSCSGQVGKQYSCSVCCGCYYDYVCGTSPTSSFGQATVTDIIQNLVNVGALTSVSLELTPDFSNDVLTTCGDKIPGASANFIANVGGRESLTIQYCEPLFSISGNVFVDTNRDKLKNSGEINYSLGTSTIEVHAGNDSLCSASTLGVPTPIPPSCPGLGSSCSGPGTCCPGLTCTVIDVYTSTCTGPAPTPIPPTPNPIMSTATGDYTTGTILPAGQYTMCYTSLPVSYDPTFPATGIGFPNFALTVGPSCNASAANPLNPPSPLAAACGVPTPTPAVGCRAAGPVAPLGGSCSGIICCSGLACDPGDPIYTPPACPAGPTPDLNIRNANFGIAKKASPWFSSKGVDMRIDSGVFDDIPSTALPFPFASLNGTGLTPGIIFSGSSTPTFGLGSASDPSLYNWKVGAPYSETYTPSLPGTTRTSYYYLLAIADKNEITPQNLGTNNYCGAANDILNCTLNLPLDPGLFIANGNLKILNLSYVFPSNQNYVILVNGDLTINGRLRVPVGSTVTFSVKGNIIVDRNVGQTTPASQSPDLEGFYSADGSFLTGGNNDCTIGADRRLNIGGSVVTNASFLGGSLQNRRNLCTDNANSPSFFVIERPDFILNAPQFIQPSQTIWQEVAP